MPTSLQATPKVNSEAACQAVGQSIRTVTQPFLRFYHSKSLRAKTLAVLATLEKAKDTRNIVMRWQMS